MIKNKKQSMIVVGAFILVLMLFTTTYAFFNYTRTGSSNTIRTGKISFNHTQGESINLTNMFPIDVTNGIPNDNTKVGEVTINVTGDTTYEDGIEYLISAVDVTNTIANSNKALPISIDVEVSGLGTSDNNYYVNRENNPETSLYKIMARDTIEEGDKIVIGYIKNGSTGVDGSITIKAYINEAKVVISDTYPEENEDTNNDGYIDGTPSSFGEGKVVLTTTEWNQLQQNGVSFKIKVEANDGIWVEESKSINAATTIPNNLKNDTTEIHFIRETPIRMERRYNAATIKADITDTNLNEGRVLAWKEGTILYVASTGETYLPEDCTAYFAGSSTITVIDFENLNTSRVTNMTSMFSGLSGLISIDLSGQGSANLTNASSMFAGCSHLKTVNMSGFNFGTNSTMFLLFGNCYELESVDFTNAFTKYVTNMGVMFASCTSLTSIDLSNLGGLNLSNVSYMFSGCTNLVEVNMENFDFGVVQTIDLFKNLTNLETVNMANAKTLELRNISEIFSGCTSLVSVDMTGVGRSYLSNITNMFYNCTSLEEVNMENFDFGSSNMNNLFKDLTNLESVNLSNAITNNVYYFNSLFQNCTSLVTVDISGLNLNLSKQTISMFYNCTSLTTVYVTSTTSDISFYISSSNSANMFYNCTSLVGGSGTTFDSNYIDSTYAHIDGGQDNPGYFTEKSI